MFNKNGNSTSLNGFFDKRPPEARKLATKVETPSSTPEPVGKWHIEDFQSNDPEVNSKVEIAAEQAGKIMLDRAEEANLAGHEVAVQPDSASTEHKPSVDA